jgi:hypothetical protein
MVQNTLEIGKTRPEAEGEVRGMIDMRDFARELPGAQGVRFELDGPAA